MSAVRIDDYKRRPASHPVLRALDAARDGEISAMAVAGMSDRIDDIARLVRIMPDLPLTVAQTERLRIIARELIRRAS